MRRPYPTDHARLYEWCGRALRGPRTRRRGMPHPNPTFPAGGRSFAAPPSPRRRRRRRRMIAWQEHRIRTLPERLLHWHPGVHPVRPRLVRRRGDHLSRPTGVPVAAHHDWTPAQLRSPPYFHRSQEVIHIDVQQPPRQILSRRGHASTVPGTMPGEYDASAGCRCPCRWHIVETIPGTSRHRRPPALSRRRV
jgi:hypothetical protein